MLNSPICPKIELFKDFMTVLVTCKSDEDSIKNDINVVRTHFSKSMGPSRTGIALRPIVWTLKDGYSSQANCQKWAKIETVRDFMPVLIISKFDEDPINSEVAIVRTIFFFHYMSMGPSGCR